MATTGVRSTGLPTRLFVGAFGGATADVAVQANLVGYLADISGLTDTAGTVTVNEYANGYDSQGYAINLSGIKTAGPYTLLVNYVMDDAGLARLQAAYDTGTTHTAVVEMGETAEYKKSSILTVDCQLGSFDFSTAADGVRQVTIVLNIIGAPRRSLKGF
ncbi:hypothetical protein Q4Q49_02440 [Shewanella sp. SP1S1-7]|uniref:hypothetical protein n=1 Tax=Shewanella sp. SP1S1-7 TaxID=3063536 RepID=UPI0028924A23|nr:hypothetical protein [Shewanella sp. SP1S1-7]MDT3334142.1 hypothetical protein [Shewanella sp. SP1S1-7]